MRHRGTTLVPAHRLGAAKGALAWRLLLVLAVGRPAGVRAEDREEVVGYDAAPDPQVPAAPMAPAAPSAPAAPGALPGAGQGAPDAVLAPGTGVGAWPAGGATPDWGASAAAPSAGPGPNVGPDPTLAPADDPPARIGRLAVVDGKVSVRSQLPQASASGAWLAANRNRPLVAGDEVFVAAGARAEVHLGAVALHLGGETSLQMVGLGDGAIRLGLPQGALEVSVPAGTDVAPGGAALSVTVLMPGLVAELAIPGDYRFDVAASGRLEAATVHAGRCTLQSDGEQLTVSPGQSGQAADDAGDGLRLRDDVPAKDALRRWAEAQNHAARAPAALRYVSRNMVGYQDLDAYGSWRTSPTYGPLWAPAGVSADWAPFRFGHWTYLPPWGWTWVDDAPWGFAPFHYGRWVHLSDGWFWAPGAYAAYPVYAPHLVAFAGAGAMGLGVGGGAYVGWFPLGFADPFWPAYRCSYGYARALNGPRPWRGAPGWQTGLRPGFAGAVTYVPQATILGGLSVGAGWRAGGVAVGVQWGAFMPVGAPGYAMGYGGMGVGFGGGHGNAAGPRGGPPIGPRPVGIHRGPVLGPRGTAVPRYAPRAVGPVHAPQGGYRTLPAYRHEPNFLPHERPHAYGPHGAAPMGPHGGFGHGGGGFGHGGGMGMHPHR